MKRILILYSELAGYLISCLDTWTRMGNEAVVIHWPVNPEAPFLFKEMEGVRFISKENLDLIEMVRIIESGNFHGILCSGWVDREYLKAIRTSRPKVPSIMLLDTQWRGSLKQILFSAIARILRSRYFTHVWLAGEPQFRYAQMLGFENDRILKGFYTADVNHFGQHFDQWVKDSEDFPKAFVFVGRYIEHKGVFDLWSAFVQAKEQMASDWKLVCIGAGDRYDDRMIHEDIIHLGFKQPEEILEAVRGTGVFVLPSHFEPWGVVVHEFAAAGFPMVLSDSVGAASQFMEHGRNGYIFKSGNVRDLKEKLMAMMRLNGDELRAMSSHSHALSGSNSPQIWAESLDEIL